MAMATVSQSLPGLQVTAPDDDMEITSDFQQVDDDLDIDLDLGGDFPQHEDDDLMLEDARSEAGQDHQVVYPDIDDVMFDDELDGIDGMMQDNQDNLTIPDEHLTDVSEIGRDDASHIDMSNQAADPSDVVEYDIDEEISREPDTTLDQAPLDAQPEYEETLETVAPTSAEYGVHEDQVTELVQSGPTPSPQSVSEQPKPTSIVPTFDIEPSSSTFLAEDTTQNQEQHSQSAPSSPGEKQNGVTQEQASVLESSGSPHVAHDVSQETADSPSQHEVDAYQTHSSPLHPVIVIYHENQISLFPPREEDESQTFFLQDESIAHQSIYELLQACRTVLGDTIRDEDELEMDIAELGLCISEDCTFAPTVSFSQILDTYTLLNQQDGVHEPDPLYMTLTTKTRFSSRFNQLNAAALQGQGISQLTFLGQPDEDESEYPPDEAPENEQSEQDGAATHEKQQQHDPAEEDQSEHHEETYAEYNASKSHSPQKEESDDAVQQADESKPQDLVDLNNQIHVSSVDPSKESHLENGPEDKGTTDNDAGFAEEQVAGKPEPEVAGSESHASIAEEEDLIDYSDDENDDDDEAHNVEDSGSGPSSASSTVQGDSTHSPKYPADPDAENQPSHFENDTEKLSESNNAFSQTDADAATLDSHNDEVSDDLLSGTEGREREENENEEFERELEEELERELEEDADNVTSVDANEEGELDDAEKFNEAISDLDSHEEPTEQAAGYDYGESYDEDYAADFEQGQYPLQNDHQDQEHDFQGQESYETHGGNSAEDGLDGEGHEELDYENNEHGDFDYPEFNDDFEDEKLEAETAKPDTTQEEAGNESDSIDYDDDEDEPAPAAPATAPETSGYRPSVSPPNKRSRDEDEDGYQDLSNGQGSFSGLRKKTRFD